MSVVLVDDGIGSLGPKEGEEDSCPGCSRWPTQFADQVAQVAGREASVTSFRAPGVPEARELVSGDSDTRAAIADASVVVVATGAFNSLPDPDTGIGCPPAATEEPTYAAWARTTKPACLAEMIKTYGLLYDSVFAEINKLRAGKPTVFIAMNVPDYNLEVGGPDTLLGQVQGVERAWAKRFAVAANDRWNEMLAERARAAGFQLVDIYHALNGPDGTDPGAQFSAGGGHPNQAGHDLIADLIAQVDLSALDPN
ncbi:GDSL-type esterase/lipase family protein [Nocardioides taihuensis]|uniref:GDSL-type esterase/lipase family protein n=1 Tax=Nocardioides taihuensis TaxID=1835606 RepID=A0ABW0BQJ2_9ACTN